MKLPGPPGFIDVPSGTPRRICRGLIEAGSRSPHTRTDTGPLPGESAGASLKQVALASVRVRGRVHSPANLPGPH